MKVALIVSIILSFPAFIVAMEAVYFCPITIIDSSHKDPNGNTLLHLAVMTENRELIKIILLKDAASQFIKNKKGETPIDIVVKNKFIDEFNNLLTEMSDSLLGVINDLVNGIEFYLQYPTIRTAKEVYSTLKDRNGIRFISYPNIYIAEEVRIKALTAFFTFKESERKRWHAATKIQEKYRDYIKNKRDEIRRVEMLDSDILSINDSIFLKNPPSPSAQALRFCQ